MARKYIQGVKQCNMPTYRAVPGCVNAAVTAVMKFTKPGNRLLAELCSVPRPHVSLFLHYDVFEMVPPRINKKFHNDLHGEIHMLMKINSRRK